MKKFSSFFLFFPFLAGCVLVSSLVAETNEGSGDSRVESFTIMNSETDQPIAELKDGATINLAALPTKKINIRANTAPEKVGGVVFQYDRIKRYRNENGAPYALAGDRGGNYNPWTPTVGAHSISATPSIGRSTGAPLALTFQVIDDPAKADDTRAQANLSESTPVQAVPVAAQVEQAQPAPAAETAKVEESVAVVEPQKVEEPSKIEEIAQPNAEAKSVVAEVPEVVPQEPPVQPAQETISEPEAPVQVEAPAQVEAQQSVEQSTSPQNFRTISFDMTGSAVIPATTSKAFGRCIGVMNSDKTELSLGCTHNVTEPTSAQLRLGDAGANGEVVCKFEDLRSPIVTTCQIQESMMQSLQAGKLYVDIGSKQFEAGEIRGQLAVAAPQADASAANPGIR